MRQKDEFLTRLRTPGAGISFPGLDEVDGTVVFCSPASFEHFVPRLVHLDEAAWRENGIHRQIFAANVPIAVIFL